MHRLLSCLNNDCSSQREVIALTSSVAFHSQLCCDLRPLLLLSYKSSINFLRSVQRASPLQLDEYHPSSNKKCQRFGSNGEQCRALIKSSSRQQGERIPSSTPGILSSDHEGISPRQLRG
mmetsp:Transcript_17568/g.30983  ORF Transcript_17568/g.30983 Transcript_17568/m.30983 type:complete len:120 (+) Transcript_17568:41-400(+)